MIDQAKHVKAVNCFQIVLTLKIFIKDENRVDTNRIGNTLDHL